MIERRRPGQRGPGEHPLPRRRLVVLSGILLVSAALMGGYWLAGQLANRPNTNPLLRVAPADPMVIQLVTDVSPLVVQAVGTGGLPNPLTLTREQPPLLGPYGHPELFFAGAQFCQYCATERWAILNVLGRFGHLTHPGQMQSYEGNISTFSFDHSVYSSQYLDFVSVEALGNVLARDGQHFVPLQPLSAGQEQLFATYNGPPYFQATGNYPFLDLGNRYLAQGSGFDPNLLQGLWRQFPLSWRQIARALSDPGSPITQAIIGTANYLTAAICTLTHQVPASACQVPAIRQIERALAHA